MSCSRTLEVPDSSEAALNPSVSTKSWTRVSDSLATPTGIASPQVARRTVKREPADRSSESRGARSSPCQARSRSRWAGESASRWSLVAEVASVIPHVAPPSTMSGTSSWERSRTRTWPVGRNPDRTDRSGYRHRGNVHGHCRPGSGRRDLHIQTAENVRQPGGQCRRWGGGGRGDPPVEGD